MTKVATFTDFKVKDLNLAKLGRATEAAAAFQVYLRVAQRVPGEAERVAKVSALLQEKAAKQAEGPSPDAGASDAR